MWRSIVLGKLVISIVASIVIGVICFGLSRDPGGGMVESGQWLLLSIFFFALAISFAAVIFLLFYRKKK